MSVRYELWAPSFGFLTDVSLPADLARVPRRADAATAAAPHSLPPGDLKIEIVDPDLCPRPSAASRSSSGRTGPPVLSRDPSLQ